MSEHEQEAIHGWETALRLSQVKHAGKCRIVDINHFLNSPLSHSPRSRAPEPSFSASSYVPLLTAEGKRCFIKHVPGSHH